MNASPLSHLRRLFACLSVCLLAIGSASAASPIKLFITHGSATSSSDRLDRVDVDGTNVTSLAQDVTNFNQPDNIQIDENYEGGRIFMADGVVGLKILKYNLDGTGRTVIHTVSHGGVPRGLALDRANQHIYFATQSITSSSDRITRINYDGTGEVTIASGAVSSNDLVTNPLGLAIDTVRGFLYVGDNFNTVASNLGVVRFNLNGTGRTQIIAANNPTFNGNVVIFSHMTVDESTGQLYVCAGSATTGNDRILRVNSDGTGLTSLYSDAVNFNQPVGIAIDKANGWLFVGDSALAAAPAPVWRFNLDGSGGRIQVGTGYSNTSTVNGLAVFSNTPPTISDVTNQNIAVGGSTGNLAVTVGDGASETPVGSLLLSGTSSNQTLVPNGNIVLGGSGANRTVNVTGAPGQSGTATITLTLFDGARTVKDTFTVTVAAVVAVSSLNRVNPTITNLGTVNWTLTFASAVTGVTASNFSLSGAAATGASVGSPSIASGGGLTWNVPVNTGSTDGTLTLSLANATGTTPGVSTTLPFAGQSYTMDKTRPTVSIGAPSASSVGPGGSVSYTVTYADANFASSSLTTGGISLNTTGGASGTIGLSGSGTSYTVTISSITGAGTIGINVAASTSLDSAGNANLVSAASTTFNVLAPPTITTGAATSITGGSAVLNGSGNGNGSVTTLTYEWGLTTSYGNTVSMGTATGAFAALGHTISGLTPGTEYHFRLVGASAAGTTNGADQSFITLSNNADLSALTTTATAMTPGFGAATTAYNATVANGTTTTTVTATRAQANATLQVRVNGGSFSALTSGSPSGALALNVGSNTIDVRVTAQNGVTQKTYTLTVTRRSIIEDWRFDFFADASGTSTRANGADFDTDGKTNLLEFAFGTDPTLGSSGPPDLTMTGTYAAATFGTTGQPIVKLEPITNGVDFRAVFIRRVDHAAAGLTYTPEFSGDNFTSFTPSATIPTVLVTSGDFQLVSVPYPHFLPNGKKARFFRVSVSIAP